MSHQNFKKNTRAGFTLIELLVVIAIIGILASIVVTSLSIARRKSRDTRRITDMNQIRIALTLYSDTKRVYPQTGTNSVQAALVPSYLSSWPGDPLSGDLYPYDGLLFNRSDNGSANDNMCDGISGRTKCVFFHIGATVEDRTIDAITSRAARCPLDIPGECRSLDDTTISGTKNTKCDATGAPPYGCYDLTP